MIYKVPKGLHHSAVGLYAVHVDQKFELYNTVVDWLSANVGVPGLRWHHGTLREEFYNDYREPLFKKAIKYMPVDATFIYVHNEVDAMKVMQKFGVI